MPYVRSIPPAEAHGELEEAYRRVQELRGGIANVFQATSLRPDVMRAHVDLYAAIMFGPSSLSRREREALAMAVSAANNCVYCILHHAEALRHHERDFRIIERLGKGEVPDELAPRMRAILRYARKLTKSSFACEDSDIEELRAAGFDDEAIVTTTMIVAYYNLVNRLVDGLGIELDDPRGFKY